MNYPTNDCGAIFGIADPLDPFDIQYYQNPLYDTGISIGSFANYCTGHYGAEFELALSEEIAERRLPVNNESRKVPHPDMMVQDSAVIDKIHFYKENDDIVRVETDMLSTIDIVSWNQDTHTSDRLKRLYRITSYLKLLKDGSAPYYVRSGRIGPIKQTDPSGSLDEYLIPVIRKDMLEDEAARILKAYYPEILQNPQAIDSEELAARLHLTIRYEKLTKDASICAQVFFENSSITLYTDDGREFPDFVSGNTIIVDMDACRKHNGGRKAFVILHECMHFIEHRLFYLVQHLYNEEIRSLCCVPAKMVDNQSPLYWLEWQANQLAARVQMPENTVKAYFNETCQKLIRTQVRMPLAKVYEKAICQVADFFKVSRQSAKIRLQELGFTQLKGVLNYKNGKYIPAYTIGSELNEQQTYDISLKDSALLYEKDQNFRKLIDSGRFIYTESHFCLKNKKFLYRDRKGSFRLNTYARSHMQECCLVFDISHETTEYSYHEGTLKCQAASRNSTITYDQGINRGILAAMQVSNLVNELTKTLMEIRPFTFGKTLTYHMEHLGFTKESLEETSQVSVSTIKRLRNEEERRPELNTVVALCIGMSLYPELSDDMIDKAGYSFREAKEDTLYRVILRTMYTATIDECNQVMQENGFKPLTRMTV